MALKGWIRLSWRRDDVLSCPDDVCCSVMAAGIDVLLGGIDGVTIGYTDVSISFGIRGG